MSHNNNSSIVTKLRLPNGDIEVYSTIEPDGNGGIKTGNFLIASKRDGKWSDKDGNPIDGRKYNRIKFI